MNLFKRIYYNRNILTSFIVTLVVVGLYLTSLYHYLLFHSIAEIFSIIIACAVFMLAWNSKEHTDNYYLVYLGIAYLFIGTLDLFHTLAYKGMNIFRDYDYYANQLWIGTRYMESLTLLGFATFVGRKKRIPYALIFIVYTLVTGLVLISVFYWKIFPICFIEGKGLTSFKKISEYIICFILFISLAQLRKNQNEFNPYIYKLLNWSVLFTIGSELAFTFYISNYGFSNLIGHYFKIASFYMVYKSIIETGLKNPFNLIFKKLKESEERYKNLFNMALVGIFRTKTDGSKILVANPAAARIFGYDSVETFISEFVPKDRHININLRNQFFEKLEHDEKIENFEFSAKDRNGKKIFLTLNAVLYKDEGYIEESILDITEQVENRLKIQEAIELEAMQRGKLEMASSVLHDIGNAVTGIGTRVARLLGEKEWQETAQLAKLENMAEQKRDAFAAALGPGKEEALITFFRELKKSLEKRSEQLHEDYQTMAKTISHVNEILHLQRRYARDGEAGERRALDLGELIDDALSMHTGAIEKRSISVIRHIPANLPLFSGDRTKLIRVFLNLLKNACEAFDVSKRREERILEIAVELLKEGNSRVIISDNAIGFEPKEAEQLFKQKFSTKNRDSGTGLYQCREIIESHGGTIRLESLGKEQGAQVIIDLPLA